MVYILYLTHIYIHIHILLYYTLYITIIIYSFPLPLTSLISHLQIIYLLLFPSLIQSSSQIYDPSSLSSNIPIFLPTLFKSIQSYLSLSLIYKRNPFLSFPICSSYSPSHLPPISLIFYPSWSVLFLLSVSQPHIQSIRVES